MANNIKIIFTFTVFGKVSGIWPDSPVGFFSESGKSGRIVKITIRCTPTLYISHLSCLTTRQLYM